MTIGEPGHLDYHESGSGPTVLFVPGSCSTGAVWRPMIAQLNGRVRAISTSLPGYGASSERRTSADGSIDPIAAAMEAICERASSPVHFVGHSFGGLVGLAVALRRRVELASLTILEAPAPGLLDSHGRNEQLAVFHAMTNAYVADFRSGNDQAIGSMIDFYGGSGTFVAWPAPVQDFAVKTTPTNLLDWDSAYAFAPSREALADLRMRTLVIVGANSQHAVVESNMLIAAGIPGARFATIAGASHFMISTHAEECARMVSAQVIRAE